MEGIKDHSSLAWYRAEREFYMIFFNHKSFVKLTERNYIHINNKSPRNKPRNSGNLFLHSHTFFHMLAMQNFTFMLNNEINLAIMILSRTVKVV